MEARTERNESASGGAVHLWAKSFGKKRTGGAAGEKPTLARFHQLEPGRASMLRVESKGQLDSPAEIEVIAQDSEQKSTRK
jgi:hypothetical protein